MIRVMNDTRSKDMTMSAADARNLHSEIFALLSLIATKREAQPITVAPLTDGGTF